jgi:glycosyltransferase involved in cell wall biosynthesis
VIHAITPLEQRHLSRIFPRKRIEIIPNAIDIPKSGPGLAGEREKKILYLGRIEPKKGADILLRAFAAARISGDWTLDIAGPVWSEGYRRQLQEIVRQFGLDHRVRFLGPVFGEEKQKLIDRAWVMAVPSHSEVVGLVNLEAAVGCLPTITTHQTGLYDWESGGGILINPRDDELRRTLEVACSWSASERRDRGLASHRLVALRYSWQTVLPIWLSLYKSLQERI